MATPSTPAKARKIWRYALPLAALALLVVFYPTQPDPTTMTPVAPPQTPAVGNEIPGPVSERIRITIGMPVASARAIQGEPLNTDKTRWDYGPSWIEVRCGRVSGWYSSPLRPLRVASSTPGEAVTPPVQDAPGC